MESSLPALTVVELADQQHETRNQEAYIRGTEEHFNGRPQTESAPELLEKRLGFRHVLDHIRHQHVVILFEIERRQACIEVVKIECRADCAVFARIVIGRNAMGKRIDAIDPALLPLRQIRAEVRARAPDVENVRTRSNASECGLVYVNFGT